ncbi:hypothetical protein B6U46_05695 [Ligilactobacillus salivarius]|jgi:hypothetical protein|nr:LapA family protein [Ligilactobacillus salivarius]MDU7057857.1 LapA family protein [Ligilactobacillus salivarius]OQR06933.1 hypothetical protein B6U47_06520 [Ligilactobacillus salivarius]OQR07557.1 hypothetical protein B6U46_05695 [Ligilactobacillus salivarius]OQR11200.1 hypothetical protein B6U45_01755 [Ligilactobacillus salivarius]
MLDIAIRYLGCFLIGMGIVWLYYKARYIKAKREVKKLQKEIDELKRK